MMFNIVILIYWWKKELMSEETKLDISKEWHMNSCLGFVKNSSVFSTFGPSRTTFFNTVLTCSFTKRSNLQIFAVIANECLIAF
mmetsp:Transcript_19631/g.28981  ORF Transcript_19631/g.28981 Transcript_19631/m.28981 type:complete len:84 (-) Transcript_19631:35-286(-)